MRRLPEGVTKLDNGRYIAQCPKRWSHNNKQQYIRWNKEWQDAEAAVQAFNPARAVLECGKLRGVRAVARPKLCARHSRPANTAVLALQLLKLARLSRLSVSAMADDIRKRGCPGLAVSCRHSGSGACCALRTCGGSKAPSQAGAVHVRHGWP